MKLQDTVVVEARRQLEALGVEPVDVRCIWTPDMDLLLIVQNKRAIAHSTVDVSLLDSMEHFLKYSLPQAVHACKTYLEEA